MKLKLKTLLILPILIMIGYYHCLNLQADYTNPITINAPTTALNGAQLVFKFSFPSKNPNQLGSNSNGSNGMTTKQFIGVMFPPNAGPELALEQGLNIKYTCGLTDGVYNYSITPIRPIASPINLNLLPEQNVAFCRLDDTSLNVPLKAGQVFTLTLTLTGAKFYSNFFRTISLFTSTSNSPDRLIMDSLLLGSFAVYGDFANYPSKPLDIITTSISVTSGPSAGSKTSSTIYAYNKFDITLQLKANAFISAADHFIIFKYPNDAVAPAISITTAEAKASDPLQAPLKGNLVVRPFSSDSIYIEGVGEDLIPNRQFKLTLTGWQSLDTNISFNLPLVTIVYYRNTYSVLSYVARNILTIMKSDITLAASHPEFWDVYRGGAYPISFTFQTTNNLSKGGWIVIRQMNTIDQTESAGNKISFIASTCDFSANDSVSFDNSFGNRQPCYPLRNDLDYDKKVSPYAGSGIFFNMNNPIIANKIYKVTVWAFFDICGGSNSDSFNVVNKPESSGTVPKFQMTVYRNLNPNKINEDRFIDNIDGKISFIAQSAAVDFKGKCWNTKMFDKESSISTDLTTTTIPTLPDSGSDKTKTSWLYYKELSDWYIFPQISDSTASLSFFDNTKATAPISSSRYLFSNSNKNISTGSYFLAYFKLPKISGTPELWQTFPTPIIAEKKVPPGKVVFQFPSAWFISGSGYKGVYPTPSCYASWNISTNNSDNSAGYNNSSKLILSNLKYDSDNAKLNFFGVNTDKGNMIDTDLTLLPPYNTLSEEKNIIKLVSVFQGGTANSNTNQKFLYMTENPQTAMVNGQFLQGAYFTSCVKWTSSLPAITSLYTYIDIQIKFNYIPSDADNKLIGTTISNVRLIKLFPETSVFNDFDKANSPLLSSLNPFVNHVAYLSNGSDAVCLLELNGAGLTSFKDSSANTLVIWLFGGTLLETDYYDIQATYPAAPLITGVSLYGLSSAQPMDPAYNPWMKVGDNYTPLIQAFKNINTTGSLTGTDAANIPYTFTNNLTNYLFFMGSILLFTNVKNVNLTSVSDETTLFVPYYCPKYNPMFAGANIKTATIYPTIVATWIDATGYSTINKLYNYVTYQDYYSAATNKPRYAVLANRFDSTANSVFDSIKSASAVASAGVVYPATLKWSPYTSKDQLLYVYNGTFSNPNSIDIICTGHSLFLDASISIDSSVTTTYASGFKGNISVLNTTKTFYVLGKSFNKGVFYGLGSSNPITNANIIKKISSGDFISDNYYTGVKRPSIDTFVSNGKFVLIDRVAFSCVAMNKSTNTVLTNYIVNNSGNSKISYFILDWSRNISDTGSDWFTPSLAYDKGIDVYKNDIAGNLKAILSPPTNIPIGAQFKISSPAFNLNSICGLVTNNIVNECQTAEGGSIVCTNTGTSTSNSLFTICCYNISVTVDKLILSGVSVILPADSSIPGLNSFLTSEIYSGRSQIASLNNPWSFASGLSNLTDLINTKSATVAVISYSQVSQEGGIGKVTFTISLPREPARDMKLSIVGDFTSMFISSTSDNLPRCYASFSAPNSLLNWDNGDALINACSVSSQSIVVTTKKIVYKCGLTFSKNLYLSLWPVLVVNWTTTTGNKSFQVNMQLNTNENIALNNIPYSFDKATVYPSIVSKGTIQQWDNLCSVTVTPKLPGEVADYQFNFDLDTNKSAISTSAMAMNEVSIFFPYAYSASFQPNIICYSNGVLSNCIYTDDGILNIRLGIPPQTNGIIVVTVVGILNPGLDANYSFPCTVNNSNVLTGLRINLIIGSGKLIGGITTSGITYMGGLRFLSVGSQQISDNNPRNVSTHKFRITFDNAIGLTPQKITIDNTPIIYINFPSDYKLSYFNNKPSVSIDEYTSDDKSVITKTSTIVGQNVNLSGNRISMEFPQNSITFDTNWRYWDINITNVTNPSDTTRQIGASSAQSTRPFYITLTNKSITSIYKIYSNINNYMSEAFDLPIDNWMKWNKGNIFIFDNSKWVVDVYDNSWAAQMNNNIITVKPGRYAQAYFSVRPNTNLKLIPTAAYLSLNDLIFKTSLASYAISKSQIQPMGFLVGCSCGTATGYYIVNFKISDSVNYSPLSPVVIAVDKFTKGIISFENPGKAPFGGSLFIRFTLSETNYDALTIDWTSADNASNDISSKITSVTIPAGGVVVNTVSSGKVLSPYYSIFSNNISTSNNNNSLSQKFKAIDPNSCYSFNDLNVITLNIEGLTKAIPSKINISTNFKYSNSITDPKLSKNTLRFSFDAPVAPSYLYCALTCIQTAYPLDTDIIGFNSTLSKSTPSSDSSVLLFYRNIINTTSTPEDIIFTNLVRGQQYHMRCIIQSTEGDISIRTNSSTNLEVGFMMNSTSTASNSSALNTFTTNLTTEAAVATLCAKFQFSADPGYVTRVAMVNYCQKIFASQGWLNNGCVICSSNDMNITTPGTDFPQNVTCANTRLLQDSLVYFTVCAVPSPICGSDISMSKVYIDYFTQFTGQLKTPALFKQNLNINNVPIYTSNPFTVIADSLRPDVSQVSIAATNSNVNGAITLTVDYSSAIKCLWLISNTTSSNGTNSTNSAILPNYKDLSICSDPSFCGIARSKQPSTTLLKGYINGTSYDVYIGCTNDIPYASKISDVRKITTVTFALPVVSTNSTNSTNSNSTNSNNSLSNNTMDSNYIRVQNIFWFILLLVIFS